jgi:hypothetical protein
VRSIPAKKGYLISANTIFADDKHVVKRTTLLEFPEEITCLPATSNSFMAPTVDMKVKMAM